VPGLELPLERHFDTIILMNMLEHIQDNAAILAKLKQRLKTTGRFLALAPAGQSLLMVARPNSP
jgi:2-polyprenyl-3-methyl-5-hydroxy-6-metoxy-1,4-benzoquinol methylase